MANPEHLKILEQGVEVWNKWRERNPDVIPDLVEANLQEANLIGANLIGANLIGANLIGANLIGANLRFADLSYADLIRSNLSGANLIEATIIEANLSRAYLSYADLSEANLSGAAFIEANLRGTDLSGTDLSNAYLVEANLSEANLYKANLDEADMIFTDLTNADITGAYLYGTTRDDWKIDGIKCDYIYFDQEKKERIPKDRDFRPGEFEDLYKVLPTIEYYFDNGFTLLDALIMDRVVQAINEKYPKFQVDLVSFDFDKRGTAHATFTVLHKGVADQALQQIASEYESKIKYLEGQRDQGNELLSQLITKMIEQPKTMDDTVVIKSGGDTSVAIGNSTSIIYKFTNQPAENLYKEIEKAIQQADANETEKEDAQDNLNKIGKELEKPKPDKSRLTRLWDGIVGAIPQIAVKLPWDEMIKKVMG